MVQKCRWFGWRPRRKNNNLIGFEWWRRRRSIQCAKCGGGRSRSLIVSFTECSRLWIPVIFVDLGDNARWIRNRYAPGVTVVVYKATGRTDQIVLVFKTTLLILVKGRDICENIYSGKSQISTRHLFNRLNFSYMGTGLKRSGDQCPAVLSSDFLPNLLTLK